jgi:hypothetical protein
MTQISYLSVAPSNVVLQTGAISCVINYSKIQEKYFLTLPPPKNEIPSCDDSWLDFESRAIDNVRLSPSTTKHFEYRMSTSALPEFKFPNTMFIRNMKLPNEQHPWLQEFKQEAEHLVLHLRTQQKIIYPDFLLQLDD